jgi:hypothetical protein
MRFFRLVCRAVFSRERLLWPGPKQKTMSLENLMRKELFFELSGGQRRTIATTPTILDEALCEFELWAKGREVRSVLYSETNSLSQEKRRAVRCEIAVVRDLLRELRENLRLDGKVQSAEDTVWSRCAVLQVDLIELESRHLKRYGKPPPEFTVYFDPKVAQLIGHLENIRNVIKKSGAAL